MENNQITCPNCQCTFSIEAELSKKLENQFRDKYNNLWKEERAKFYAETAKEKEAVEIGKKHIEEMKEKLQQDKQNQDALIRQKAEEESQKKLMLLQKEEEAKNAEKFKFYQNEIEKRNIQLKAAEDKEIEMMKREYELQEKERKLAIEAEQKVSSRLKEVEEKASLAEREKSEMTIRERDKTIEDLKKLMDEMKRKSEQGSMQLQGEVQEMALEDLLKKNFPFDHIEEVGKGVKGADVIQSVRNHMGDICGKIIYESKRTKTFSKDWIDKLKEDLRAEKADIAILVTEVLPKEASHFLEREGVWICTFHEVRSVSQILRTTLIKLFEGTKAQENKGEKMHMLYEFLTGNEFKQQMEAIVEGFSSMQDAVKKEKLMMEKVWKEREKQLEKVLLNAVHFYASVKGIAGASVPEIKLLEGGSPELPQ
ncbi:MAG: DUF2130 domain-containing protein [Bacteroidota bacterium]